MGNEPVVDRLYTGAICASATRTSVIKGVPLAWRRSFNSLLIFSVKELSGVIVASRSQRKSNQQMFIVPLVHMQLAVKPSHEGAANFTFNVQVAAKPPIYEHFPTESPRFSQTSKILWFTEWGVVGVSIVTF